MSDNVDSTKADSASSHRSFNNVMRHEESLMSDFEKEAVKKVKDDGRALHEYIDGLGNSREISLAKAKIEEAVIWAQKHLTV